ncbi:MAG: ATP synthase subunit I [Candidatus Riflebacteria bacterium HGW-Riflebacteria-1]|jgi:F1F0 ATPase subunit 2|nr:MAG: ATP synthase subunit I [Candidatus Riflebacteria bacterium HGW-Riflebacteria-1]
MNETISLVMALAGGITLGVMFFAGLWWTVNRGVSSEYPVLWFFSSLMLRTVIALTGFHYFAGGSSGKLFMCLFGFFVAHQLVIWFTRTAERKIIPDPGAPI